MRGVALAACPGAGSATICPELASLIAFELSVRMQSMMHTSFFSSS